MKIKLYQLSLNWAQDQKYPFPHTHTSYQESIEMVPLLPLLQNYVFQSHFLENVANFDNHNIIVNKKSNHSMHLADGKN